MTIEMTPEEQAAYEAQAAAEGLSIEQWLKQLAEERVRSEDARARAVRSKSLLELLEPLRGLELDTRRNPSTGRTLDL